MTSSSRNLIIPWKIFLFAIGCLCSNACHHRKWMQQPGFNSWMRLFVFPIVPISLRKAWIQLFSLQLWVNSRADYAILLWHGNQFRSRKLWIQICYRTGVGSSPPGYFYPRHATWVVHSQSNQVTRPVRPSISNFKMNFKKKKFFLCFEFRRKEFSLYNFFFFFFFFFTENLLLRQISKARFTNQLVCVCVCFFYAFFFFFFFFSFFFFFVVVLFVYGVIYFLKKLLNLIKNSYGIENFIILKWMISEKIVRKKKFRRAFYFYFYFFFFLSLLQLLDELLNLIWCVHILN